MIDHSLTMPAGGDDLLPTSVPSAGRDQRYRELFEGTLLGIYVSRPNGELLACNAAFARMLGFASVEDAVGSRMHDVYNAPGDRDQFVAAVRAQSRLEHHRGRLRRRDGGVVDVIESVVGEFDASGALTELRGFLIDVTASVEAELALREREGQFRAVFFAAADAMLVLDDSGNVLEANLSACALFGVPADSIRGEALGGLLENGDEQLRTLWRELLASGDARCEHRVRARGAGPKETRVVECSYRARVHGPRHVCIARDITERRLLEERLVQAEKIESVGRLAGGIAHDFNNLLTAILGYTELLLDARAESDPDRTDLEEIQKAGQRAAVLTQQLLAFSRKQALAPQDVDLNVTVAALQTFPAAPAPAAGQRVSPPPAATRRDGVRETILLVEDDDPVREIISGVLRRQGYNVVEASGARAACEIFERRGHDIDLLLTDIVMPEMGGPALAQRLIGLRPQLRVLFISGYADMCTAPGAGNPNAAGFLSKPFRASVLASRVGQMLALPGPAGAM